MILETVDKSLQAKTAVVLATTAPGFYINYEDSGSTQPVNSIAGLVTEVMADILAAPAENTTDEQAYVKRVKFLSINNQDTITHTVTIQYTDANGPDVKLFTAVLEVDWTLEWLPETGWKIYNASGAEQTSTTTVTFADITGLPSDNLALDAVLDQYEQDIDYAIVCANRILTGNL